MNQLYWNVNPELVIKQNDDFKQLEENNPMSQIIIILVKEYRKVSEEIKNIIKKISYENFEESMTILFDREAYLSEIYIYLSTDIIPALFINKTDIDILELIRKDYLRSYYWKLSEINQKEYVEFFLKKWAEEKYDELDSKDYYEIQ
ncbi:hypothetical protein G8B32_13435 [Enterococcus faecalis]|uniref:hypothetical protein n=1 Tax=Enterococcus faecalis TaxID=1351 RepID=UPI001883F528|nr:hypothetical protein [Enterococcus faecalis]MBE9855622.1 hypothetical protein [Enterococcus faecalis]